MNLVARMHDGDRSAFREFAVRYAPPAYHVAAAILGPGAPAALLVREAFAALFRARGAPLLGAASEEGATLAFVRELAIAHRDGAPRRAPRREPDTRWDAVLAGLRADDLDDLLRALPAEERALLELVYGGGHDLAGAAVVLDIDLDTARDRFRLALQHVRDAVRDAVEAVRR